MNLVIYGSISLVILFFLLISAQAGGMGEFILFIEWSTKYILPWIALFWFIKMVKSKGV
ncbi:hypothetical protein VBD025_04345 [Virgibacillus flavescens]|uniref:hypothetical protein n=1 Tax=Virgibacillus flavescens TaxID=1611422 RepID=UPI003D3367DA